MANEPLLFRVHAIERMARRNIGIEDVRAVLDSGEVIEDYPDDFPYPSALVLGWVKNRPLHVVVANLVGTGFQKEKTMKCPICKKGDTALCTTTVTLQRDGLTLIVKSVPAEVCDNCGEAFVDEKVTAQLLDNVESEARDGSEVNVRHFQAA